MQQDGCSKEREYPGLPTVINGNGAVAHVMGHVCGGVIGYPITPSTEISEIYESFRAGGGCNVWAATPSSTSRKVSIRPSRAPSARR